MLLKSYIKKGVGTQDLLLALTEWRLAAYLAWSDIRQRYRRSSLGPWWITISTGCMISCIGVIFGNIFETPTQEFFPFLASGMILWAFINSVISESSVVFVTAEATIKQLPLPLFTHILRMIAKNFIILLHNLVILPIVFLVVGKSVSLYSLLFIPNLFIVVLNLMWISLVLSVICTRFRDFPQIVQSLLQVFFYITPVIWMPGLLAQKTAVMVLEPNPFYHLIELIRAPLLGHVPSISNYVFCVLFALIGWGISLFVFNRFKTRIAYWL